MYKNKNILELNGNKLNCHLLKIRLSEKELSFMPN